MSIVEHPMRTKAELPQRFAPVKEKWDASRPDSSNNP
jgi:hypothetical protein